MSNNSIEITETINRYQSLIRPFITGKMTAPEFEDAYLSTFKADATDFPRQVFDILEQLFGDVDEYVADQALREKAGGLDDDQLRQCAQRAFDQLQTI